ncbi:MAG: chloride channel protein [Salinigranum sp.]
MVRTPWDGLITLYLIATVVGIIAGFGAIAFRIAIWAAQLVFFDSVINPGNVEFSMTHLPSWLGGASLAWIPYLYGVLEALGPFRILLLPAIGGLIVGLYIRATYPEVKGHGTERTLEAILVKGGQVRPSIAFHKTVASAIAIASGGSLGREGPIVQIGSAMGSYFSEYADARYARSLVAAGGGAGIAATFNAPLTGIMFALEILLQETYIHSVMVVAIASVMATAVARPLLNFTPLPGAQQFLVPVQFQIVNPFVEYPLYIVLGIFVALIGTAEVHSLYGIEDRFDDLDVPGWVKPGIGGALLGVSVLVTAVAFHVNPIDAGNWLFGVGYNTIHDSLTGQFTLVLLLVLMVMKILGFSLSIGSGSSGGVFSPSLFIGAMFGGAYGLIVHALLPASTAGADAYALVAMAGVFAAAARAPLTSTLIVFELSGQYTIILPLLLVTVIGSEIANQLLTEGTIYTEPLKRMGYTVQNRRIGSIEDLTPGDVMTTTVDTVRVGTPVQEAIERFRASDHHGMPIVDEDDRVVGMLTLSDLDDVVSGTLFNAFESGDVEEALEIESAVTVEEIGSMNVVSSPANTTLLAVIDQMETHGVGRIPIVDTEGHLLGIVTRSDILDAYDNTEPGHFVFDATR